MALERTILDFLAATLVAIDGSRAGPIHPAIAAENLEAAVVRPMLASADAVAFRAAIEGMAVLARGRMAEGGIDTGALTRLLHALTGHLLAADGHPDPFAAVLEAVAKLGFNVDLSYELLDASFRDLERLSGFARALPEIDATPDLIDAALAEGPVPWHDDEADLPFVTEQPVPLSPSAAVAATATVVLEQPPFAAQLTLQQPAVNFDFNFLPPPIAAVAPLAPLFAPAIQSSIQVQPAPPSVPPMIVEIARAHAIAPQALMPIVHHPALATVPLSRLEEALVQSAGHLAALASRLADAAGAAAGGTKSGAMEREARIAILAGDLAVADQLLAGIEARATASVTQLASSRGDQRLAKRRLAETKGWRAVLAEARLAYGEAATCYGGAAVALDPEDAEIRWLYALRQGTALQTAFEVYDDSQALAESIVVYAQALEQAAPGGAPRQPGLATLWVLTQNSLGNALTTLGERTSDVERFRFAAWSYNQAISVKDRQQAPGEWALLHVNHATALMRAAELASTVEPLLPPAAAVETLQLAIRSLDCALEVHNAQSAPLEHFTALLNRGIAQARLGFISKEWGHLQAAAEGLATAAAATPGPATSADRVRIATHLGDVCSELAELSRDPTWLDRAIDAYDVAFELVDKNAGSAAWAGAATNLANALWTSGRLIGDSARLLKADRLFTTAAARFEAEGAIQPAAAINQALTELRGMLQRMQPDLPPSFGQPRNQSMTIR